MLNNSTSLQNTASGLVVDYSLPIFQMEKFVNLLDSFKYGYHCSETNIATILKPSHKVIFKVENTTQDNTALIDTHVTFKKIL
jgi:hypothetical protein